MRRGWLTTLDRSHQGLSHRIGGADGADDDTAPSSIGRPRLAEQLSTSLLPQYFVMVSVAIVIVAAVQSSAQRHRLRPQCPTAAIYSCNIVRQLPSRVYSTLYAHIAPGGRKPAAQ